MKKRLRLLVFEVERVEQVLHFRRVLQIGEFFQPVLRLLGGAAFGLGRFAGFRFRPRPLLACQLVEKVAAALDRAVLVPAGALDAVIVGDDGELPRHGGVTDQVLDQVVGLVLVDRKTDVNALVDVLRRHSRRRAGASKTTVTRAASS